MKLKKIDFSVAILSGLACFALLFKFPVWALFFGWAWYGPMGGNAGAFKKAIPPMLLGYLMAAISIIAFDLTNENIFVMVISVAVTVFIIMLSIKTKVFAEIVPSFNAYSCMFAGFYFGAFPVQESSAYNLNNVFICIAWLALANVVGLCFGFISTKIANIGQKSTSDK